MPEETTTTAAPIEAEFVDAIRAGTIIGVSRWTIYDLAKRGKLPSYTLPGSQTLRFKIEDVRALLVRRSA